MRKLFVIAILLFSFSLFAEAEAESGDVSGNDLNPILRGFNFQLSGGILAYVGDAGGDNAGSPIGSAVKFNIGYDIDIKSAVNVGIAFSLGMLQYNTNPKDISDYTASPWFEDYNPLTVGLEVNIDWMITKRWELGLLINFDYYALAKTYKSGSQTDTNSGNIAIGGGLDFEYYTVSRHFSLGMSAEFNYVVDFDGMNIIVTPFMKYTF
ncbi:MAG TPA: adventurous gliding motility protein CglE [bacterium]|nr:adventurous gliding motility protein CglE [bacterium]HPS29184.1 adventurous gliding motility protein CglE [bacterium]